MATGLVKVIKVAREFLKRRARIVNHKGPPMRNCDSLGVLKLPSGDGAQDSAIKVDHSQPGALIMAVAGQNDDLVAMHGEVGDRPAVTNSALICDLDCGLDCGNNLQICIEEGHGTASSIGLVDDSIGPLSLLVHCTSRYS
eukprot:scaffold76200_cov63-Phaeocystis_antarctica.AAC.2